MLRLKFGPAHAQSGTPWRTHTASLIPRPAHIRARSCRQRCSYSVVPKFTHGQTHVYSIIHVQTSSHSDSLIPSRSYATIQIQIPVYIQARSLRLVRSERTRRHNTHAHRAGIRVTACVFIGHPEYTLKASPLLQSFIAGRVILPYPVAFGPSRRRVWNFLETSRNSLGSLWGFPPSLLGILWSSWVGKPWATGRAVSLRPDLLNVSECFRSFGRRVKGGTHTPIPILGV
eukprot:3582420-Pyramimonas_sp.AAC.1